MDARQSPSPAMDPKEAAAFYEMNPVDIAVIGGGPAGFSAAINARTRGRSVVILSGDYRDSYLYKASELNNVPGEPGISGARLLDKYYSHAVSMGAIPIPGRVLAIVPFFFGSSKQNRRPGFQIGYGSELLLAKTVIIATGAAVSAPYPGESEFLGRGVSYCATCDGMLYRGKEVAVIAKARDAVEEAAHLVRIGCIVRLFVNPKDLERWDITIPEGIFASVGNAPSFRIEGDEVVTHLAAGNDRIPVAGVFILRSTLSPQSLLSELAIENNYIKTDRSQATNIPGVFAAGDCTGKPLQVAKALGEGLVAGLSADAYLASQEDRSGKAEASGKEAGQ